MEGREEKSGEGGVERRRWRRDAEGEDGREVKRREEKRAKRIERRE